MRPCIKGNNNTRCRRSVRQQVEYKSQSPWQTSRPTFYVNLTQTKQLFGIIIITLMTVWCEHLSPLPALLPLTIASIAGLQPHALSLPGILKTKPFAAGPAGHAVMDTSEELLWAAAAPPSLSAVPSAFSAAAQAGTASSHAAATPQADGSGSSPTTQAGQPWHSRGSRARGVTFAHQASPRTFSHKLAYIMGSKQAAEPWVRGPRGNRGTSTQQGGHAGHGDDVEEGTPRGYGEGRREGCMCSLSAARGGGGLHDSHWDRTIIAQTFVGSGGILQRWRSCLGGATS